MPKDIKVQQKLGGLTKTASDRHRSWGYQPPWGGLGVLKGKFPYPQFLPGSCPA